MNIVRSDEDRFADFLQTALRDVHTPVPATPKEDIWAGIAMQRQGLRLAAAGASAGAAKADIVPDTNPKARVNSGWGIPTRWALPIAAALVIGGVGLGWQFERARLPNAAAAPATQMVATRLPSNVPTELAEQQHIGEVKHLFATFYAAQKNGTETAAFDAQVSAWARNLLPTTELLLDSPLGMDPQHRKLLMDVELVLVQLSQLAPSTMPGDRALMQQSITHSQVLEHLQNTAPQAAVPSAPSASSPTSPSTAPATPVAPSEAPVSGNP